MGMNISTKPEVNIEHASFSIKKDNISSAVLRLEKEEAYIPAMPKPDQFLFSSKDLVSAQLKVETPLPKEQDIKIDETRQTERKIIVEQAIKSAATPTGINKAESYKNLVKSLFELTSGLATAILLAITTAVTGGATTPLLVVSSLVLINAIINAIFAVINVSRAKKNLPPINVESFIWASGINVLKKMNVSEKTIAKLDISVFNKMITGYKVGLIIAQTLLNLLWPSPPPAIIGMLFKISPAIAALVDKLIKTSPAIAEIANKSIEVISSHFTKKTPEEKEVEIAINSGESQTRIRNMARKLLSEEKRIITFPPIDFA